MRNLCSVAKAEHRIEECLRRAKSETGLGDYEVRYSQRLVSSSDLILDGKLVFDYRNTAGKKNRLRQLLYPRFDMESQPSFINSTDAVPSNVALPMPAASDTKSARSPVSLEET